MNTRPININPLSIKLPLPALISITHRLSGVFLFLLIPAVLYLLDQSLHSSAAFGEIRQLLSSLPVQITLWLFTAALLFHLIAGFRHLLMDMHFGDSLKGGRVGALVVAGLALIAIVGAGYCIWG